MMHSPRRGARDPRIGRWYSSTGWWTLMLALAHLATTGRFYGDSLRQLLRGPLIGALDADPGDPARRGAAFWYAAAGALLAGFGWSTWRTEKRGRPPSTAFAVSLTALGSIGTVASPRSGFPAVLAIGAAAALRRLRAR